MLRSGWQNGTFSSHLHVGPVHRIFTQAQFSSAIAPDVRTLELLNAIAKPGHSAFFLLSKELQYDSAFAIGELWLNLDFYINRRQQRERKLRKVDRLYGSRSNKYNGSAHNILPCILMADRKIFLEAVKQRGEAPRGEGAPHMARAPCALGKSRFFGGLSAARSSRKVFFSG